MHLVKPTLLLVLAAATASYAMDCGAMMTVEQAMQCCDTMPCATHGSDHSQECCKTMPSMQTSFVQPAAARGLSFSPVFVALPPGFDVSEPLDSPVGVLTAQCHAPPIPVAVAPSPLRI
jgi:hypothetical protein